MNEKTNLTLTKKTIEDVLAYIKSNKMKEGDKLPTEAEFLKILGVSRIILREAFSYLKGLGLLESRRGSGFRIAQIDFASAMEQAMKHIAVIRSDDLEELMELRRHLELGTVYEAVCNANADDIDAIKKAFRKLEKTSKGESFLEYQLAELEFHQAIMTPAKCRTLNIVNMAIRKFFDADIKPGNYFDISQKPTRERELTEHKIIASAFELNWPDVAVICLRKHLMKTKPEQMT
jgi:GntR family transcriptional repressor for pyruvate dehydrogenase complex